MIGGDYMLKKISSFIEANHLFHKTDKLVIALSGGVDSMVLFSILQSLGYQTIIAHVNHHKRAESEIEEQYIINMAQKYNIPYEINHYYHTGNNNFHDDAHTNRYSFFQKIAQKYGAKVICTAHHADDNLETVIANIMTGSNLYGYSGISPKLTINNFYIVRPLLLQSKDVLKKYAKENEITYFDDSSNDEDDYKRNRIRHHIIPTIKNECPDILDKTISYSIKLRESFLFIRSLSEKYLKDNNQVIVPKSFSLLDEALQKDIICLLLEKQKLQKNEKQILLIQKLINNDNPQGSITLCDGFEFKKRYNLCFIEKFNDKLQFNEQLNIDNKVIIEDKFCLYFSKNIPLSNAKFIKLCYNDIAFPLIIRNRMNEDAIKMPFGHKKLKDLFIDKKVPMEKRDNAIVVCDSTSNILWVINYAKSELVTKCKATGDIYLICEELKNA